MCPAIGNGNPHFSHIHEKKNIKEDESKERESRTLRNRTEPFERKHTGPQDLSIKPKITLRYI
jgi:hypothetical protein